MSELTLESINENKRLRTYFLDEVDRGRYVEISEELRNAGKITGEEYINYNWLVRILRVDADFDWLVKYPNRTKIYGDAILDYHRKFDQLKSSSIGK